MKMNYIYEIWKPIKGFEGLYEVSNFGRVKSLPKITNNQYGKEERILKPGVTNGYYFVCLCKNGKNTLKLVHRLVAEAFLPNPDNLPCVNHKGENPSKNFVWQLEWCTQGYNINYGHRNNKVSDTLTNRTDLSKPVLQFDLNGNLIKEYPSIIEAERQTGFNNAHISKCCLGKRKTAYKYIWKYKEKAV